MIKDSYKKEMELIVNEEKATQELGMEIDTIGDDDLLALLNKKNSARTVEKSKKTIL